MIGPYFDLVRRNRTYRRYWIGMGLSMAGEWFTTIALFVLITVGRNRISHSGWSLRSGCWPSPCHNRWLVCSMIDSRGNGS